MAQAEEIKLRNYLLGQLSGAEEEQVELRLLTEPDFAEEYDIVISELTDDYAAGKFAGEELKQVEEHFFKSTQRRDKLKFALALKERKAEVDADKPKKRWFRPYLAIAAALVLLAGGGFYLWRVSSNYSDLNKGLAALQSAFRDERPLEARISKFNYAPYPTTRGPGTEKVDQDELRRAELILLTLKKDPTPAVHYGLGKVHLAKKEFDQAIQEFDEALKGDPKNAQIYSDLGAAWLEKGKIDRESKEPGKGMEELGRSLENLNKALELNPNLLEAIFNRALCKEYLTLFAQAQDDWREYLKRDSNSPWADEARRHQIVIESAAKYSATPAEILEGFRQAYQKDNPENAWQAISQTREMITGKMLVFQLVRQFLSESENRKQRSGTLALLAYAGELERDKTGDPFVGDLATFYGAATQGERDLLIQAQVDVTAGYNLCLAGRYAQALDRFEPAKGNFKKAGNLLEAATVDYWIAYCENQNDHFGKSLEILNSLLTFSRSRNYKWIESQALALSANSQVLLGQTSRALADNQLALQLSEQLSDTYNQRKILTEIGAEYTHIARSQRGLGFLEKSLALGANSAAIPRQSWRNFTYASEAFYSLRLYDAAAAYEEEALHVIEEQRWPASLAHLSQIHLGMIYGAMHRYDEATRHLEESLHLANSLADDPSSRRMIGYSTLQLAHLKRETGDCTAALQRYDDAVELYDQMAFDLDKYDAHKGRLLCYIATRSDNSTEAELNNVLRLFEKYRTEILEEQNRNSFFDSEQNVYDIAVDYAFGKGDYEKAFSFSEASRARSLLDSLRSPTSVTRTGDERDLEFSSVSRPLTLSEIRNRLPPGLQLVQYNVLKDRLLIWVISNDRMEVVAKSIPGQKINEEVIDYVRLLTSSESQTGEVNQKAVALYKVLISPIESKLDVARDICFIPDKTLCYLPFASLVAPETRNYLISSKSIQFSPSASVLVLTTEIARSRFGEETLLSVGNPAFRAADYPDLTDLPAAEHEAREIATNYKDVAGFFGHDAIKVSVIPQLEKKSIIHFACHYIAEESLPMDSKLVLACPSNARGPEDGVLTVGDILQHRLRSARLVVLSACQTAGEHLYNGEGMVGMARTFLLAGAPLVVASQWPVDSNGTAELMIKFHHYRKIEGLPTIAALRRAQLDLLSGPYGRPYYWSGFIPVGGYTTY